MSRPSTSFFRAAAKDVDARHKAGHDELRMADHAEFIFMFDHVSITVSDIAAAERFYDAIMKALGVVKVGRRDDWLGYVERARAAYPDRVYLTIRKGPKPEEAFGRHWCFKARWQTQVDAFWDAGIAAGGTDDGPPGPRDYHASYYGAFLRDPDGNRVEAVCHHAV
jgi:catechol 2,3-dioxygenase-like lactoylglutathione lyase family enzyme